MIVLPAPGRPQQEAHRLPGKHVLINRTDLVGQRIDRAAAYRHIGVKQVSQLNPGCRADESEEIAASLEAPLAATTHQFQFSFIAAKQKLFAQCATLGSQITLQAASPSISAVTPVRLLALQALAPRLLA